MFLISATPAVASYATKQKAKAATPARQFGPSSTGSSSGIFQPLVVSRMNRAGTRDRATLAQEGIEDMKSASHETSHPAPGLMR